MSNGSDAPLLLYQTQDGRTRLEVRVEGETVWLSLNQMAELFQRDKSVISRHIKNVFGEGELSPAATVAKFATVQIEGPRGTGPVGARGRARSGTRMGRVATRIVAAACSDGAIVIVTSTPTAPPKTLPGLSPSGSAV